MKKENYNGADSNSFVWSDDSDIILKKEKKKESMYVPGTVK